MSREIKYENEQAFEKFDPLEIFVFGFGLHFTSCTSE